MDKIDRIVIAIGLVIVVYVLKEALFLSDTLWIELWIGSILLVAPFANKK